MSRLLYHGGVAGLWRGHVLLPDMAHHRFVEGCACCEAQRAGVNAGDAPTPTGWVYATADKPYARYYASRAVGGTLYRVRLEGDVELSTEDPSQFPTWRGRRAVIVEVLERRITLTMEERRRLFLRWGGTEEEFELLLSGFAQARGVR